MMRDRELFADLLPTYLTRFVGRESEIAEVQQILRTARLVTIHGIGGSGKTRLAIEVARRLRASDASLRDAVYWVPLSGITDPGAVAPQTAAVLTSGLGANANPTAAAVSTLRDRQVLVVIDSCEQVVEACRRLLGELLSQCPELKVLTTTRTELKLHDERVFAIPALAGSTGRTDDDLPRTDATDLFVDRAATVSPVYALTASNAPFISRICERLHGLPLAIELAASRVRVLSARDLLSHLEAGLDVLSTSRATVADRHRSMRAVLESSWLGLDEADRSVLAALSVFVNGFTVRAADVVAGASLDCLERLAEASLIQRLPDSTGGTRLQMHDLVRAYALARLETSGLEAEAVRLRHFEYFAGLTDGSVPFWNTAEPAWDHPLRLEVANIDAAMSWAVSRGDAGRALRLMEALDPFWVYSIIPDTVERSRLARALSLPWDTSDRDAIRARARALNVAGWRALGAEVREAEDARRYFAEGLLLFRQLDDQIGIANSLRGYGVACLALGDAETNRRHSEESLAICRNVGDRHGQVWSTLTLAGSAQAEGRLDEAVGYLAEAVKGFRDLQVPFHACEALLTLGDVYRSQGNLALALDSYRAVHEEQRRHRFVTLGDQVVDGLAQLAAQLHRFGLAARLTGAATAWNELYGHAPSSSRTEPAAARRPVGEPDWDRLCAAGARLNPEQAMQLADEALDDLAEALASQLAGLTEREVEVLRLVALGLSNAEIAERLVLSPRTVHAHLRSVFDKLGVTTRTAAAHHAVRLGLAPE